MSVKNPNRNKKKKSEKKKRGGKSASTESKNKKIGKTGTSETEEKKISKKEQSRQENKILRNILIGAGVIILAIFVFIISVESLSSFDYKGVEFNIEKFCDSGPCLVTYHTQLPVIYKEKKSNYHFYLRNDPRKLEEDVPFNGELDIRKNMLLKITFNKHCSGFETIAVQNVLNLYRVAGTNISSGQNSTCENISSNEDSMFILIQEANKTSIEKTNPACYTINVNSCEILEGTERFMTETFVELNKML